MALSRSSCPENATSQQYPKLTLTSTYEPSRRCQTDLGVASRAIARFTIAGLKEARKARAVDRPPHSPFLCSGVGAAAGAAAARANMSERMAVCQARLS